MNHMLGYLTNKNTTLDGKPVLQDNERWHDLDGQNYFNKQHIGRILFHILRTVNPQYVDAKEQRDKKLEIFKKNRKEAINHIQSAQDIDALKKLNPLDGWDDGMKEIFDQIKKTILSAEEAKEILTPVNLDILKPLPEGDEKNNVKLKEKEDGVKKLFGELYEKLLGANIHNIFLFRESFLSFPTTTKEIEISTSTLNLKFKTKSQIKDLNIPLTPTDRESISEFIRGFDSLSAVSEEVIKKVLHSNDQNVKIYIAWFLDFYFETMAENFDEKLLKSIEDLATLHMVFKDGDWHQEENKLAAIILGGDAGSGKGTLGFPTTSAGTEGVAGGGQDTNI